MSIDTPPLPGDVVGAYTLQEVLGVGGMATVYRAVEEGGRPVAVKILHPGKAGTDDARRFRREFLTLRELRDPNVVEVYEAGVHGDYPWIAMELVDGTDLGTLVERWALDPPPDRFARVEAMLRALCAALAHVHEAGLIHRDIKPSNVLVTRDGQAKLTDFGVVKAPGQFTTQLTMAGRLVGTIAFMAPEQITGDAVDSRADLYSLGAVLYVMLTDRRPIQADSIAGYLARHLTHTPQPPSELDPRVPPRLEEVCLNLLRKDPAQRYASARQVLAALDQDQGQRRLPVHGREEELARLLRRVEQVAGGEGGVVVLVAPEGTGKSALLDELVARARAAGQDVAWADGAGVHPLRALRAQLPVRGPAEEDLTDPGEDIADLTTGRPWTLVLDHLDRLAPMELEVLTRLVRRQVAIHGEPLLLITAVDDPRGRVAGLIDGSDTGLTPQRVELAPLDHRAVTAMVRDRGLGGPAGAALGRRLAEEALGLPGAVREHLDAMVRAGWLVAGEGGELRCTRPVDALRDDPLPVPERFRQREVERLSRLTDEALALLDGLAILATEAPLSLAASLVGLDAPTASQAATSLAEAGLVSRRISGVDELVHLASDRTRDVVLDLLAPARRGQLHRAAAALLGQRGRRRPDAVGEEVIRHLLAGGERARAYPLLLASSKRRLAAGQVESAARLLRRAAAVREEVEAQLPPDEVARHATALHALQGEAAWRLGDLTGAQEAWDQALGQAQATGDAMATHHARAGVGLVLAARGEGRAAAGLLRRAVEGLPPGDPMWAPAGQALAEVLLGEGEVDAAHRTWRRLLEVGEAVGSERVVARALAGVAQVELCQGSLDAAAAALTRAATRLRVLEDDAALVPVLLRLSEALVADGRLHDARERAMEAERSARSTGRLEPRIQALGLAATALASLGTDAEGRQVAREAVAMARSRDLGQHAGALVAVLPAARALLDLGLHDEAAALFPAASPPLGRGLDAPAAQVLAVQARVASWRDAGLAVDLARQALAEPAPALSLVAVRVALDAARALIRARAPEAPAAIERARGALPAAGGRLLALECCLLASRCHLPEPAGAAAEAQARALDEELGAQGRFARRWMD
ncbi:protein kinase [Myxococcota bacterium]|nr:protein kinase [Myxococcota bacterium]